MNSSPKNALTFSLYVAHPIADVLPVMETAQLSALTESVRDKGLLHEIVLFEDKILDGRARQEACQRSGTTPRYRTFVGSVDDAWTFVVAQNLERRHLSDEQRAMIAASMVNTRLGSNQHHRDGEAMSIGRASALLNAKLRTVARYLEIARNCPAVAEAVVKARITFPTAKKLAELPKVEQDQVLSLDGSQRVLDRETTNKLKLYRRSKPVAMPDGLFCVLVFDAPWPIKPEPPYSTMSMDEIKHCVGNILRTRSADDCFAFLWATEATREFAIQMMKDFGWTVRESFVWHKSRGRSYPGRPHQNAEYVVLAEKGKPEFIDTVGLKLCFSGEVSRHSEKPAEFYAMIERATTSRRLELFARNPHEGFELHGNDEGCWLMQSTESQPTITVESTTNAVEASWPLSTRLSPFQEWLDEESTAKTHVTKEKTFA